MILVWKEEVAITRQVTLWGGEGRDSSGWLERKKSRVGLVLRGLPMQCVRSQIDGALFLMQIPDQPACCPTYLDSDLGPSNPANTCVF